MEDNFMPVQGTNLLVLAIPENSRTFYKFEGYTILGTFTMKPLNLIVKGDKEDMEDIITFVKKAPDFFVKPRKPQFSAWEMMSPAVDTDKAIRDYEEALKKVPEKLLILKREK